jgi:hypothetical protein
VDRRPHHANYFISLYGRALKPPLITLTVVNEVLLLILAIMMVIICLICIGCFIWFLLTDYSYPKEVIMAMANKWREAWPLPPVDLIFEPRLKTTDVVNVDVSFLYPTSWQTELIKNRITASVDAALAKDFSIREGLPTFDEIQHVIDAAIDTLAEELDIPIFFAHVRSRYNARNSFGQVDQSTPIKPPRRRVGLLGTND